MGPEPKQRPPKRERGDGNVAKAPPQRMGPGIAAKNPSRAAEGRGEAFHQPMAGKTAGKHTCGSPCARILVGVVRTRVMSTNSAGRPNVGKGTGPSTVPPCVAEPNSLEKCCHVEGSMLSAEGACKEVDCKGAPFKPKRAGLHVSWWGVKGRFLLVGWRGGFSNKFDTDHTKESRRRVNAQKRITAHTISFADQRSHARMD